MPTKDIVVVGASSGGIEALRTIVAGLREDFAGSMFVVMHTGPGALGILQDILNRAGSLPVVSATDRQRFETRKIYVAPADKHMLLEPAMVRLTRGPKENLFRPAIDPLFRSAAQVYGPRVIGVILTGGLDDGTAGLWAIKKLGGTAVVQHPDNAMFPSMPLNALRYVSVDHCVTIEEMAPLLTRLTTMPAESEGVIEMPKHLDIEVKVAKQDPAIEYDVRDLWEKTSYTCPECHGVLLQLSEGGRQRFRCHTGHAFSADGLLAKLTEGIEETLWSAIRNIEESVLLMRHLARHLKAHDPWNAREFLRKAEEAEKRSELVRSAVYEHEELNIERVKEEAS
jgi:two-component system, chemotaxis family, protein-glutamate methylesterase/glutaminase